jgi:hypothetical protein
MWVALFAGIIAFLLWRSLKNPTVAIAGTFCLFGLEQWGQAKIPFLAAHGAFTNFAIGALLAISLGVQVMSGRVRLKDYPAVGYLVILLLVYAYASSLWAPRAELSAAQWVTGWPYLVCFVFIAPLLLVDTKGATAMLSTFVIVGTIVITMLLFFVKWQSRFVVIESGSLIELGNPLATAQMAGNVMLVAILCRYVRPIEPWVVLRWVVVAACIALTVKTGSRGQVLTLLIVLAVFWPMTGRNLAIWPTLGALVGVVVLGLGFSFAVQEYWGSNDVRWSEDKILSDAGGRWDMASRLLSAWWGGGPVTILAGLGNSAAFDSRIVGFYPHILTLEILAEEGLFGLLMFMAFLVIGAKEFKSAYRHAKDSPEERGILVTLAAMFTYAFLLSFKQGNLVGNVDVWMVGIFLAKYGAIIRRFNSLGSPTAETQKRRVTFGSSDLSSKLEES